MSFRLTVPFLSVSAPELTTISGPDGQPIVGEGPIVTESGLGDILASVTVFDVLASSNGDLAMDLTGKIKFGTADEEKGLGTGEQDYSLQADVFRFFDKATLMGTAGYALRGDPESYDLDDTFYASLGASLRPCRRHARRRVLRFSRGVRPRQRYAAGVVGMDIDTPRRARARAVLRARRVRRQFTGLGRRHLVQRILLSPS